MMVRTRLPGGRCTAAQLLAELDIADRFGNGTLRATSRQGFQHHGVVKGDIQATIRAINEAKLSTIAACGDVSRNVMACPAPIKNDGVRDEMHALSERVAQKLTPKSGAYYEVWLRDGDDPEAPEVNVTDPRAAFEVEPLYGLYYLPRKFKVGIALPEDNCIDIHTQDLGFLTIAEGGKVVGYNVLVGGGMGQTPSRKDTFPRLAEPMAFVTPEQAVDVAVAVVGVQRDFGNRQDRKRARMKYLIHDRGLAWFKQKVEEYYGGPLPEPRPVFVTDTDDHLGWRAQGDGNWYLGLPVPDGRIADFEGGSQWKSCLRELLTAYGMECRVTALAGILLCDINPDDKPAVNAILKKHGCKPAEQLSLLRRNAMACVSMPTCGLAVAESERVIHDVVHSIEARIAQYGLSGERIAIHMTGCPNGCARPYTPDIGIVGKSLAKYTLYLGGNVMGTRLAFIYDDLIPFEKLADTVSAPLAYYKQARNSGESFGDFCARVGKDDLQRYAGLMKEENAVLDGELGRLNDKELAVLLNQFAGELNCEQLQRALAEGSTRLNNGSANNGELKQAVTNASGRLELTVH